MSDNSSGWRDKHVQIFGLLHKKATSLRFSPKMSRTIDRALEVLSVFLFAFVAMWMELCCIIFMGFLAVKCGIIGKLIVIWYITHWYNDYDSPEHGRKGQGSQFVRNSAWMRHFTNYFPVKCVKTVDLPPNINYLFAVFPHGIISLGAFGNFATTHTNFHELFPGIRSKLCTLSYHFKVPFYRDLLLGWGMMSATKESIVRALSQSNNKLAVSNYDGYTSNAVALVVGGAQEALHARPGNYRLVLNKRKGFVKIAIQTGAPLVPVFSFGELELFDQACNDPGTKVRAYQDWFKKLTGVAPAFFYGRGFLQRSFGFLPHRGPLITVIGAPIEFPMNLEPTQEEIDELHGKFVETIRKLFDDHKEKYLKNHQKIKLVVE